MKKQTKKVLKTSAVALGTAAVAGHSVLQICLSA